MRIEIDFESDELLPSPQVSNTKRSAQQAGERHITFGVNRKITDDMLSAWRKLEGVKDARRGVEPRTVVIIIDPETDIWQAFQAVRSEEVPGRLIGLLLEAVR